MMSALARQTARSCPVHHSRPLTGVIGLRHTRRPAQAFHKSSSSSSTTSQDGSVQQQHMQAEFPVSTGRLEPQQQRQQQQQQQHQHLQASVLLGAVALLGTAGAADAAQQLHLVADVDAATAHTLESILRPLFAAFTVLYIIRIPMTWYPSIDGTKLPWLLAYAPTEPILKVTRNVIPLVGGVDVTPIVWVGLISFFNEILLGPQGILMLIQRESGAGLL